MRNLSIPSSAIALRSEKHLTPAMVAAVWEIAAKLDEDRVPAEVPNSVWIEMPAKQLRGEDGRTDNVWLRQCLDRLTEIKISGEHKGNPWGAVLLAAWEIVQGGSVARLLVPPPGVKTLRAPETFAKIEADAVHRLTGHGRRLYAILADKKRLGRPYWTFTLEDFRELMGVNNRKSYQRWDCLRQWVLIPAVEAINDYGTVTVKVTPEKLGRSVVAVRFDWHWKDPHAATETATENERHSKTRRKAQETADAPPMIEDHKPPQSAAPRPIEDREQPDPALTWWHSLTHAERENWGDCVGRTFEAGGKVYPRRDADIATRAFDAMNQGRP